MPNLDLNQIEELTSNLRAVSDATYSAAVAVADVYNATSSYDIGDYCIKSTLLYKCNTAIPSGEAWDSGHWNEICVSDELNELRGNLIYVGTSAPSNPKVQLWFDTDEEGVSVVNSVNNKSGTVVLDADDVGAMSKWELLWTNASPASSFAAQTISIDLSNYNMILVQISTISNTPTDNVYGFITYLASINDGNPIIMVYGSSGTNRLGTRKFTTSTTGVSFQDNIWNNATTNAYGVPYKIYGIKGVQTS